jgi:hypothetical protein
VKAEVVYKYMDVSGRTEIPELDMVEPIHPTTPIGRKQKSSAPSIGKTDMTKLWMDEPRPAHVSNPINNPTFISQLISHYESNYRCFGWFLVSKRTGWVWV